MVSLKHIRQTLVGNGTEVIGNLSKYSGDIPVGKYIKVKIN